MSCRRRSSALLLLAVLAVGCTADEQDTPDDTEPAAPLPTVVVPVSPTPEQCDGSAPTASEVAACLAASTTSPAAVTTAAAATVTAAVVTCPQDPDEIAAGEPTGTPPCD